MVRSQVAEDSQEVDHHTAHSLVAAGSQAVGHSHTVEGSLAVGSHMVEDVHTAAGDHTLVAVDTQRMPLVEEHNPAEDVLMEPAQGPLVAGAGCDSLA